MSEPRPRPASRMRRRIFLKRLGFAGAAIAAAPRAALLAFEERENRADLDAALAHAKASARPLLALIVPADVDSQHERQATFGSWLLDVPAARSGRFAEVDLVCVALRPLAERVPGLAAVDGEPWCVLLEWDGEAWSHRAFADELPPRKPSRGWHLRPHERIARTVALARDAERSAILSDFLDRALAARADVRADRIFQALSAPEQRELRAWRERIEDGEDTTDALPSELRRRAASWMIEAFENANDRAAFRWRFGLAEAERLLSEPPPGSEWHEESACGGYDRTGPEKGQSIACGSAFMTEMGRTFLSFYMDSPR